MPEPEPSRLPKVSQDQFMHRFMVATALVVAVILFLIVFWRALYVLLLMFAGVLLAVLLRTLTNGFSRLTRLPDGWALTCVILLLALGLSGLGLLVVPSLVGQIHEFRENQEESIQEFRQWTKRVLRNAEANESGGTGPGALMLEHLGGIFSSTLGAVTATLLIVFVGIFLAAQPSLYVHGILRLFPLEKRARAAEVVDHLGHTLRWWLVGQLISMVVLSTQLTLGLWLLGVPLAFTLGLLAAVLTFVPYVGPVISTIPAVLIAWTESGSLALSVLALYLVVQNLEGYLITPLVHQRTVLIPPALTLFAQMLMGILWGALGVILATPLAAVGLVLMKKVYVEDVLGDSLDQPVVREPQVILPPDTLGKPRPPDLVSPR